MPNSENFSLSSLECELIIAALEFFISDDIEDVSSEVKAFNNKLSLDTIKKIENQDFKFTQNEVKAICLEDSPVRYC